MEVILAINHQPGTNIKRLQIVIAVTSVVLPSTKLLGLSVQILIESPLLTKNMSPTSGVGLETPCVCVCVCVCMCVCVCDSNSAPQVLIYTLTDGVHACPNVTHLSDELLTCVHSVSSRMRTGLCVAVCRSVCCSALKWAAVSCSVLQGNDVIKDHTPIRYAAHVCAHTLTCVQIRCSRVCTAFPHKYSQVCVLQCAAMYCVAVCCSALQCIAVRCSVL